MPPPLGTGSTMSPRAIVIGSVTVWPLARCQVTRSRLRAYEMSWLVAASAVSRQTQTMWYQPSGPRIGPTG